MMNVRKILDTTIADTDGTELNFAQRQRDWHHAPAAEAAAHTVTRVTGGI